MHANLAGKNLIVDIYYSRDDAAMSVRIQNK